MKKITHLAVMAHQDDVEFWAYDGILKCFNNPEKRFGAVVVTDGAGSPRAGKYAGVSDDRMKEIRKEEQEKAAKLGDYEALFTLGLTSAAVKNPKNPDAENKIREILLLTKPDIVYTHNLADKHETHVAVALRTLSALRGIEGWAPQKLYGCEGWRDLDWLCGDDKIRFDVSGNPELETSLLTVFESQTAGGKRYDSGVSGRRLANASLDESHGVDAAEKVSFAMDLTPLISDKSLDISSFAEGFINRFKSDVLNNICKLG
jgi:LmbE family N-acetylglucosaminyl deacetylase